MTSSTATATLAERLTEARAIEQPLRQQVATAEQAMREAAERADFPAAEEHRQQLEQARASLGIATATTNALQAAADELEQQRRADLQVIEQQRARDQAQQQLNAASEQERELMDQLERAVAEYHAGLAAVQRTWRYGLQLEDEITRHRGEVAHARALLAAAPGETPQVVRPARPNRMSALADQHEHVRVLARAQL